ncbi:MAG: glycoside hydrolase family 2 [Clostridia bacterium]|nr:glycoside hydrolase family 2 [Clostridia bacterium]
MAFQKLTTIWGEKITDKPLQEYPRPQFVRNSYVNLNGWWDYAITEVGDCPSNFDGRILVPFSPETTLSGVRKQLKPKQYLFYHTSFTLNKNFNKGVVLLHFGAVDSICDVYVNGNHLGHHEGGYNAFSVDITTSLLETDNHLVVRVRDFTDKSYHTNGKQSSRRGGMWYTPQSGIWQTVWLESVPSQYISSAKITPDFDNAQVIVEWDCNFDEPVTVVVMDGEEQVAKADGKNFVKIPFPDGKFTPWTPENPHLYGLRLISRRDSVDSYFGMRKFSTEMVGKHVRLMLNNKPYFHNGLLDQGYWSDGLYTPPSDEAMIFDIQRMKDLGFNTLRKHIKVEPMRWYYHCDRLGMLVWQDMPSGGTRQHKMATLYLPFLGINKIKDSNYGLFSRKKQESRDKFLCEYTEMLDNLYNCVSIAMWVPFNEAWGQFDAKQIAQFTKDYDGTRTVDHASGWHDQGGGDIKSLHVYFKKVRMPKPGKRAICLTEFGGYSYKDIEHSFNKDKTYSYKLYSTQEEFEQGLAKLYERDVIAQIPNGLSAAIYTQVSDVEDEVNGLYTFDRKVLKVSEQLLKDINSKVKL